MCKTVNQERGQILMLVAVLLTGILGLLGLVIDAGHYYAERRQVQNAADQAAQAGALEVLYGGSASAATTAANQNAAANGFNNDGTTNTVTVTTPYNGDLNKVEVVIDDQPKTFFIHVLVGGGHVRARGVAGSDPIPKNYALVVLNPSLCSAYNQTSNISFTIVGGGSMVDSSCRPSGSQGGGGSITADYIDYYSAGSWLLSNNATTSVPPTPFGARVADPLASLTKPVPGSPAQCPPGTANALNANGTASNPQQTHIAGNGPVTLCPGTYYGGIKIDGSGAVTLLPGLYVIAGGGLSYSATSSITGNGLTIFNTYDSAKAGQGPTNPNGNGACDSIAIQGSGTLTLTAPTSGTYKDMLFWQDPACTNQFKYAGSSYTTSGIIYLPTAQLSVTGGGSLGALQIIVDSFSLSGSAPVTINYGNYLQIAQPRITLME
jgi:Flp pilus assembly protein TadG